MKIGELARKTGVSIRSLRYYEQQKLISPVRTDNGYREYSPLAVEQVKTIRLYLNLGFTTEQIAGCLHCVLPVEGGAVRHCARLAGCELSDDVAQSEPFRSLACLVWMQPECNRKRAAHVRQIVGLSGFVCYNQWI